MRHLETIRNNIMPARGVDGILVTDPYNFHYLSGFGGEGLLVLCKSEQYLLTDSRYTIAAKEAAQPNGFTVLEYNRTHPRKEHLAQIVSEHAMHTLGYEDLQLTVAEFETFRKNLPTCTFVAMGEALTDLRMKKSDEEIAYLAQAEAIGDAAFADVLPLIRPGITELELAAEIEYAMKKHGASGLSFETIVASGVNSAKPHHQPTEKKIVFEDFVTMDFGCIYHGYCSDMTRTVVVGKATAEQKKVYETVRQAQQAALDAIRPGLTGAQVDCVARDIIEQAGYKGAFGHGLGHSVGLYIHESPTLSPREERVLEAGYIETVEPGIYIEGFGGVRIEDMVVLTADGCRNLASSPKELLEL